MRAAFHAHHRRGALRRLHVRGVSLIEVLVVIVLMAFGLIGVVALQAKAAQFAVSAEDSQRAALLASEIAAEMWAANTLALDAGVVDAWAARVADAAGPGLANGVGTVVVADDVARVTVQWRPPGVATGSEYRYVTDVVIPTAAP